MAKAGRKPRPPTDAEREKVEELVGLGSPIADIAKLIGRSVPTVRKYFRRELDGRKKTNPACVFAPTDGQREKVIRYIGCKMKPDDVARVLDISVDVLKEHFAEELKTGAAKARAAVLDHLHDQMAEGLVGATNRLEALTAPAEAGAPGQARMAGPLGKKAAAKMAAQEAIAGPSNPFAPRPPPKLVVNNGGK